MANISISASSIPTSLPPTLSHLLRSNEQPSPHEETLILELARLVDVAISDPAPSVQQQHHHKMFQKLQHELQIIRAPVRRVPPEVLQEIFLAMDQNLEVFDDQDPHYVVGCVCRGWRIVSRGCPQMWCNFELYGATSYQADVAESHLRSILNRTHGLPISFGLFMTDNITPSISERETLSVLLGVLGQYSAQWSSVGFVGLPMNVAHVLSALRGRMPLLKSLQLEIEEDESEGAEITAVLRAFEVAPELSHVLLGNVSLGHIALPKTSLQSLVVLFREYSTEEIMLQVYSRATPPLHEILHHYPNLRTVNLNRLLFPTLENTAWPPVPLPQRTVHNHLVSLETSDFVSFFHISLPSLKELRIGPHFPKRDEPLIAFLPAVSSLLRDSHCSLSRLTLYNGQWNADALYDMLSLAQQIEELNVAFSRHPKEVVSPMLKAMTGALLARPSECNKDGDVLTDCRPSYLLPKLKTLRIKTLWWAFVEMTARRWDEAGLQTVVLDCKENVELHPEVFSELEECDWERLRAMKKGGLDITWQDCHRKGINGLPFLEYVI